MLIDTSYKLYRCQNKEFLGTTELIIIVLPL